MTSEERTSVGMTPEEMEQIVPPKDIVQLGSAAVIAYRNAMAQDIIRMMEIDTERERLLREYAAKQEKRKQEQEMVLVEPTQQLRHGGYLQDSNLEEFGEFVEEEYEDIFDILEGVVRQGDDVIRTFRDSVAKDPRMEKIDDRIVSILCRDALLQEQKRSKNTPPNNKIPSEVLSRLCRLGIKVVKK